MSYVEIPGRGGRNIDPRDVRTGEEVAIQIPVVTAFAGCGAAVADGSPRNKQHEHIPVQSSCVKGTAWLSAKRR